MSLLTRQVVPLPVEDLTPIKENFMRQTRLDLSDLPESMEDSVLETLDLCVKNVKPMGVFCSVPIEKFQGNEALLTSGHSLKGEIVPLILERSFEVVFYTATLNGFADLMENCADVADQYFLDAWGTAFIENAGRQLKEIFEKQLEGKDLFLSNYWSPGQHNFPIENQADLFAILRPEEIHIQMTERFMMHPTKSISSIMGIMTEKDERNLFACDFCPRRDTCLSAYGGLCSKEE